jgi:uncharacterized phage-associated protein
MLIQGKDGVVGELIAWNFSPTEMSYALVKLLDGQLCEWGIPSCRVVEERKTSEQGESPATDRQQLQAKIRLVLERIKTAALEQDMSTIFQVVNETYAELSAMQ